MTIIIIEIDRSANFPIALLLSHFQTYYFPSFRQHISSGSGWPRHPAGAPIRAEILEGLRVRMRACENVRARRAAPATTSPREESAGKSQRRPPAFASWENVRV